MPFAGRVLAKNTVGFLRNRLEGSRTDAGATNYALEQGVRVGERRARAGQGWKSEQEQGQGQGEEHSQKRERGKSPTHPEQTADSDD